jgi:hypothetical protein
MKNFRHGSHNFMTFSERDSLPNTLHQDKVKLTQVSWASFYPMTFVLYVLLLLVATYFNKV